MYLNFKQLAPFRITNELGINYFIICERTNLYLNASFISNKM